MSFKEVIGENYRDDWNTPECVLERVRKVGDIALDPCSNTSSIVRAAKSIMLPDDGLAADWATLSKGGLIYVNPPYGREIGPWVKKCGEVRSDPAYWSSPPAQGATIALLPARTDTRWFQDVWSADAICFWRGRLTFLGAPAPAKFPSVVAVWAQSCVQINAFESAFADAGHVVRP